MKVQKEKGGKPKIRRWGNEDEENMVETDRIEKSGKRKEVKRTRKKVDATLKRAEKVAW